jgi:hypothetical protein
MSDLPRNIGYIVLFGVALLVGKSIVGGFFGAAEMAAIPSGPGVSGGRIVLGWAFALLGWGGCLVWAFLCGWWAHGATGWGILAGLFTGLFTCMVMGMLAVKAHGLMPPHMPGAEHHLGASTFIYLEALNALVLLGPPTIGAWYAARQERRGDAELNA